MTQENTSVGLPVTLARNVNSTCFVVIDGINRITDWFDGFPSTGKHRADAIVKIVDDGETVFELRRDGSVAVNELGSRLAGGGAER